MAALNNPNIETAVENAAPKTHGWELIDKNTIKRPVSKGTDEISFDYVLVHLTPAGRLKYNSSLSPEENYRRMTSLRWEGEGMDKKITEHYTEEHFQWKNGSYIRIDDYW